VISSTQPDNTPDNKPDNTQHSQETDIHATVEFEPTIPASERLQTHALDGADSGIGGFVLVEKTF
jgi:hypothetical protein